jgi:hypothetical protein
MKADATTAVLRRPLTLWLLTAGGFFAFFTFLHFYLFLF